MPRPDSDAAPAPEFSRPMRVSRLSGAGEAFEAVATEEERAALARRYGVAAVPRLRVEGRVLPDADGWRVEGVVRARLVQRCVVTLDEVASRIEERFSRRFLPGVPAPDLAGLDPDEAEDPPEPLGPTLDPAEMAAEAAALAIDPYPRAPGAAFEGRAAAPAGAEPLGEASRETPFARLAALRGRLSGEDGED